MKKYRKFGKIQIRKSHESGAYMGAPFFHRKKPQQKQRMPEQRRTKLEKTVSGKSRLVQENGYNEDGQRISRSENGTIRNYYYDNGAVAYTKDGDSVSTANVLNTEGVVVGSFRGKDWYSYLKDAQGSTCSILKEDGSLAAAYDYTDFGETEEITGGGFDNEICYTGAVYDVQSGLYYMNARYYDPENGRFISQDSYRGEMDDPGQWHLYAYCANNPVNYVDPSGHDAIWLNSSWGSGGFAGHSALLVSGPGKKWRYFSWEQQGYRSKRMYRWVFSKYINKSKQTVSKKINEKSWHSLSRDEKKPYDHSVYIKGNFSKSAKYIRTIKNGESKYKKYSLVGTNCAWMAIQVLKQGGIGKTKRTKLTNLQYAKNGTLKTIIPNSVRWQIGKIFGKTVKPIK